MQDQKKNYKEYRKKVSREGKKAVKLMESQPLSREESIEMFKRNMELATQMRTQRLNNKKNKL